MASEIVSIVLSLVDNISKGIDSATKKVSSFGDKAGQLAGAFTPISLAAGAALAGSAKLAVDFDKSIQAAVRSLDLSGKEVKEFQDTVFNLQKELKYQFSAEILANLAAEAGKLGIAKSDVDDFTRVMAKLAVATDQVGNVEELSTNMAKVATTLHLSVPQMETFGNAVNKLDDATSATSNEIIKFTKGVSGVAASAKLSATEVAAWGATLISSGQAPNVAATFMNKFLTVLGTADHLSDKATTALNRLGVNGKQLAVMFDKDASRAMQFFMDKLKGLSTLEQRGVIASIFGQEHVDSAMQLLSVYGKVGENLKLAGDAAGNAAKMQNEFNKQAASFAGLSAEFKNRLATIGIQLGQVLLPGLIKLMGVFSPLLDSLQKIIATQPQISTMIVAALGVAAVIAPLLSLASAIASIISVIPLLQAGIAGIGAGLWAALAPALPILAIGAAIAGLGYLIYKNWTPLSKFFINLWNGAINEGKKFINWVKADPINATTTFMKWFNPLIYYAGMATYEASKKIAELINWVWSKGTDFYKSSVEWGKGLINGFVDGLQSMYGRAQQAMNNWTSWIAQYLPHSDAKKGALSRLTASGKAFSDTFMAGIQNTGLDTVLGSYLQNPISSTNAGGLTLPVPASNSNSLNYQPIYNISAKDADDILKQLRQRDKELLDLIKASSQRNNRGTY